MMNSYYMSRQITGQFDNVVDEVEQALSEEGFGVLTRIDVTETLKKKLGVTYPDYVILGACHPASAYQALESTKDIGLLLPCNVIVYEDAGKITISAIRPTIVMQMVANPEIAAVAQEVEEKLCRVMRQFDEK